MAIEPKARAASGPSKIPHWRMILDQRVVTDEIIDFPYDGAGTKEDPYVVSWIPQDPRNPMNFSSFKKWSLNSIITILTLSVSVASSGYAGTMQQIITNFDVDREVVILGVSVFVLGFAFGPLVWAPLSETLGRRIIFIGTFICLTAFNAGATGSQNIWTLVILRFLAGFFGSSPFGNSGGTISDLFPASHRGLAMGTYSAASFMGPALGPIVGGFLGEAAGWRWVEGLMAVFTGLALILACLFLPETYAPVLLRGRAEKLSEITGKVYISRMDIDGGKKTTVQALKIALHRPWILLFREPIVFLCSFYLAVVYGILYMLFDAYPIVFQEVRGWSEGKGGLAFLGVLVGMILAFFYIVFDNMSYARLCTGTIGRVSPERRLHVVMLGSISLPIGLFWFAWTNSPSIHWMSSIAAGAPFGFGMVLIFLGISNYLVDSYVIYAASAMAASSATRAMFGAIFPLFTTYMYEGLGIHWASCVPAFLSLACIPCPLLFYFYGPRIRARCHFSAEASRYMGRLMAKHNVELQQFPEQRDSGQRDPEQRDPNERNPEELLASTDAENQAANRGDDMPPPTPTSFAFTSNATTPVSTPVRGQFDHQVLDARSSWFSRGSQRTMVMPLANSDAPGRVSRPFSVMSDGRSIRPSSTMSENR